MGAHPLLAVSRRGLNPIKPVYDPDQPDGRLNLTVSTYNQLGQYTSSPGAGVTAMQNSPFSSLTVVVTIASTHCAYSYAVQHTWLTWSRSARPTLIGSSAPLRPEQPRYRELGPSSEDGLSLSAVPTCETVFLRLSAPSTPTRPSAVLLKLICSSSRLAINCFYFLFFFFYFTICLTM